jgi:hypothetical protein
MAPITFVFWALWAITLSFFHLEAWFDSRGAIVCADRRAVFFAERGANPIAYRLFDDGRFAVIDMAGRYPFSLRSARQGIPQTNTLRFVERASGRTLSALTTSIDSQWSTIGRAFAWSDQLLVWTFVERRDQATGNPVRIYSRFLTDGATETQITGSAAFEPRAVDVQRERVASLEVRQRVMGRQPEEHELPPQSVRIESFAGADASIVATFPVRRALHLFFDKDSLMVLRWERDSAPPHWHYRYRIFLDRHDPPDYATAWTVELTPQATEQGSGSLGPELAVVPGQPAGTFALRYLDNADRLFVRNVRVDTTSGEIVESSVEAIAPGWSATLPNPDAGLVWRRHGMLNCVYEAGVER